MAKWGSCEFKDLEKLRDRVDALVKSQKEIDAFFETCAKELAARFLATVVMKTPVGDYKKNNDIKRYKRGNKKKGIEKGDIMFNKNDTVKREKYKTVSFQTKGGKDVSFKATTSKVGGTLRRGWTCKTHAEAENGSGEAKVVAAYAYADTLAVTKKGGFYEISIINPVEYAAYVEYGHRTKDHKGWVRGRFMMKMSEEEVNRITPAILERRFESFLKGQLKL